MVFGKLVLVSGCGIVGTLRRKYGNTAMLALIDTN
jgi:hypothetical protein